MNILITIFRLNLTGSSDYTFTLAKELISLGHNITIFSPFHQQMSSPLRKIGVQLIKHGEDLNSIHPDVILAQHNFLAILTRIKFEEVPMIYISHGVIDGLEFPPSIDLNIGKFIAVSEEVGKKINQKFGIKNNDIEIIRNGIDLDEFVSSSEIKSFPKKILYIASRRTTLERLRMIEGVCTKLGSKLTVIGKDKRVVNFKDYILDSDLVISVGRGILAAMSCGRAALVFDHDRGDGLVTEDNVKEIWKNNFSGRRFGIEYDELNLSKEIQSYRQEMGKINRKIVEQSFSSVRMAEKILAECEIAIKNFKYKKRNIPGCEMQWMYENFIANLPEENWKTRLKNKFMRFF